MEARITYEQLFDTLRREKSRDELQALDPNFYANVQDFLAEKKETITTESAKGLHSLAVQRATIEYQNVRKLLKELYERRERKIITLALHRTRTEAAVIDTEALLPDERGFFDRLVELLLGTRHELLSFIDLETVPSPRPRIVVETTTNERGAREPEMEEGDTFSGETEISVRFLASVPKFVGKDMKVFGPYEEGAAAVLPESIANILIKKGRAIES